MKKRTGEPWMPATEYGHSLPAFMANLVVRDIDHSLAFYKDILGADILYADPDFAALRLASVDLMLHADHAYDGGHLLYARLAASGRRGPGAELRLFGVNPPPSNGARRQVAQRSSSPRRCGRTAGARSSWKIQTVISGP